MILVDTSVWIDYFRGVETPETAYLVRAVSQSEDISITGIVLTEILQGLSSDKECQNVKSALSTLLFLPMSQDSYYLAADIYRAAKSKGHTIRNTVDCLIAACAISHKALLLHNDRDFIVIAKFSKLKLVF